MMRLGTFRILDGVGVCALLFLVGCTSSVENFQVTSTWDGEYGEKSGYKILRHETGDQGSGDALNFDPEVESEDKDKRIIRRATIGGSYLRQVGVGNENYLLSAGIHGNPEDFDK